MPQQSVLERRMSTRIPTSLELQVYSYGMLVANGVAVEMSKHGLQIRIKEDYSADELNPGKHLDVMLQYLEQLANNCWMPIMVVRKWDGGVGARFIGVECEESAWRQLS